MSDTPTWTLDPAHSAITFTVRHMVFAKVHGSFKAWEAELSDVADDLSAGGVSVTIDAASIDTGVGDRDAHLRSGDFFDVETFPELRFASTGLEKVSETALRLTGDLTIKDVTRPVTLEVEVTGRGKDPWGNQRIGFSAAAVIDRTEFGLTWNQLLEAGGVLVGDKIKIAADVQLVRAARSQAA